MKFLRGLLKIVVLLLILFLIYAAFTPKQIIVKKEVVLDAPKEQVFDFIRSLKNVSSQTVWQQKDPNVKKTYRGTDGQVGSVYRWESEVPDVGVGEQEVIAIEEGKSVTSQLRFEKPFEMKDQAIMLVEDENGGTRLIWDYKSGEIAYPMNAFIALQGVQKTLEKDFEKSLSNIKNAIQSK